MDREVARIGDHRLITCEIRIAENKIEHKFEEFRNEAVAKNPGWKRKDKRDRKYWDRLKEAGRYNGKMVSDNTT
jgi:hypothetical protein